MNLPTFETYCSNTTAANALVFDLGNGILVWYSYKTPVAFSVNGRRVVRENVWGPTTGKHLNAIDDGNKKGRIGGRDFERQLNGALDQLGAVAPV